MIKLCEIYNEIKNQQPEMFCDMDGVIADFDLQFKNITGYLPKDYEQKFGKKKFWSVIPTDSTKFWAELEWMPGGKQLWEYIKKYNPKLLSAPSRHDSSRKGKQQWVDKHLPGVELILKAAKDKQEYAGPNKILIDDRQDNIDRWNAAGGIGIIYLSTDQVIDQLKQLGL